MKKTLRIIMAMTLALLLGYSTLALTLDSAEEADLASDSTAVLSSIGVGEAPMTDDTYGDLIAYFNFDETTPGLSTANYIHSNFFSAVSGHTGTVAGISVSTDPTNSSNRCVKVENTGTAAKNMPYIVRFTASDKEHNGTFYVVYDYYMSPSALNIQTNIGGAAYGSVWNKVMLSGANTWKTDVFNSSVNTTTTTKLTLFQIQPYLPSLATIYYDNIRIYFKENSTKTTFKYGTYSKELTISTSGNYTLPAPSDIDATWTEEKCGSFYGWLINGNRYDVGQTLSASIFTGNTVTALTIPYVDAKYGNLIAYQNFDDPSAAIENTVFLDSMFATGTTKTLGASSNFSIVTDTVTGSGNYALYASSKSNTDVNNIYCLRFTDAKNVGGVYYVVYDRYSTGETRNFQHKINSTEINNSIAANGVWETEVFDSSALDSPITACENVQAYVYGTNMYIDNLRVYRMPDNTVSFINGKDVKLITFDSETTYTIPSVSEIFTQEESDGLCYTDGTSYYFAGQSVSVSDIIGKILTVTEIKVPVNSGNAEMRVTSASNANGIRFKASIAPSVKNAAAEYGFIVAREDVLEAKNAELTFDFTEDGKVLHMKGIAYKKDENGDVVTNIVHSDNEDGSENYTAVCIGIDTESKTQITTKLTARPYIIYNVSEGVTVTAYGKAHSESLYGVAKALKTAYDSGDENAANAYNSASYDGGNLIDDIITTAEN